MFALMRHLQKIQFLGIITFIAYIFKENSTEKYPWNFESQPKSSPPPQHLPATQAQNLNTTDDQYGIQNTHCHRSLIGYRRYRHWWKRRFWGWICLNSRLLATILISFSPSIGRLYVLGWKKNFQSFSDYFGTYRFHDYNYFILIKVK